METIIQLIITPFLLVFISKNSSNIIVKDLKSAFWTSLWIMVVGFLVGWLLTFIVNVLTLGIFWMVGLGIVTRTVAYAIVIEIVDRFSRDFTTKGFLPSLWLAILLAVAWGIVDYIF